MSKRWDRLKSYCVEPWNRVGRIRPAVAKLRARLPGRHVVIPALFLIWLLSGIFIISPADLGAVYRWGRLERIVEPGPHYHMPWPIEKMRACAVEHARRFEINFNPQARDEPDPPPLIHENAFLLTADEQLAALSVVVQARVDEVEAYLSHVDAPDQTVFDAAQAALSAVVARYPLESVLMDGKRRIEQETLAALQTLLDRYKSGLSVVAVKLTHASPPEPVQAAFGKIAQAREQQRQTVVEAAAYENKILPLAQSQAEQMVQMAEAYKARTINQAKGDADGFLARLAAYQQAPVVTRKRLYLDTMAAIAGQSFKVVMPSADPSILPTLPLDKLIPLADRPPMPEQESK